MYFFTDNFYVFELDSRQIFYHFNFFFYRKVDLISAFDDVHAVTTTARYHSGRNVSWYTYRVKCVLSTGLVLYLSDETHEELERQNRIARKISTMTGAQYVKGLPSCNAVVKRSEGRFSFDHFECSWWDTTKDSFLEVFLSFAYVAVLIAIGKRGPEIIQILKSILN